MRNLILVALVLASRAAAAGPSTEITNDPAHPVPVSVQGPVTVQGGVTVQNGTAPLAVALDPSQPVASTPLAEQSSVVLNGSCIMNPQGGGSHFQEVCGFPALNVTPGHTRFILDSLSVYAEITADGTPWVFLAMPLPVGFAEIPLPFAQMGVYTPSASAYRALGGTFSGAHLPIDTSAGPTVYVNWGSFIDNTAVKTVAVTLMGHYVAIAPAH